MWDIEGSSWFKTDLHLHTTASKCFTDRDVTAEQWIAKAMEEKLNCVAVTDHNTGDGIDKIKKAAEKTNIKVFPGVEITCSDSKVHILALFELDKDTDYVNSFLASCGIKPDQRGEQNTKAEKTVSEVIQQIKEYNGIAIPAHIDQYSGLGEIAYESRSKVLDVVDGVHVVHKEFSSEILKTEEHLESMKKLYGDTITEAEVNKWKKAFQEASNKNKSLLTFSDNPSAEKSSKHGLWGIGKRYTWIKMDKEISLEGLRQALMMPELRISNDFSEKHGAPENPNMWLHSVEIKDTKLNEGRSQIINFNPNMTTIIGGRGTGKSSILRFLRGIFNKNEELKPYKELYEEQKNFFQVEKINKTESLGILKESSDITLKFHRHGKPYTLSVNNFENSTGVASLKEWNEDKNEFYEIDKTEIATSLEAFDFDIYSQKQIYEIAKETNALRDIIDKSIIDMGTLQEETNQLRRKHLTKAIDIKNIEEEIVQKGRVKTELKDLEVQFKQLTDGDLQEIFNNMKSYTNEMNIMNNYIKEISLNIEKINEFEFNKVEINLSGFNEIDKAEIKRIAENYTVEQSKLEEDVRKKIKEMEELKNEVNYQFTSSVWHEKYQENKKSYAELKKKHGIDIIEQLENLKGINGKIISLQSRLDSITKKEDRLINLKEEYRTLEAEFKNKRKEVYQKRVSFVELVLKDTDQIRIKIVQSRDLKNLEIQIRDIIQKPNYFNRDIENIIEFCNRGKIEVTIEQLIEKIHKVRSGEEDDIITGRFVNVIKELNHEQISNLNLLMPEDDIKVEYKNSSNNWEPLSHASAGQKTSAILTFLLSYGNKPLILDQPEDDLDNFLIYELIVERMKAIKNHRQIIIVTHNANIPVNGDSELVITMDSKSEGINVLASGSLEKSVIKDTICTVMEGGRNAFKLRAKKYNLD